MLDEDLEIDRIEVKCPHCGNLTDIDVAFYENLGGLRHSWVCQPTYSMGSLSCFKPFSATDLPEDEQSRISHITQYKSKHNMKRL